MAVGNQAGGETLRNLLIANNWLEILAELTDENEEVDIGYRSRIGAIEESTNWLISCGQSCPSAIRRGPILGLRSVIQALAHNAANPGKVFELDEDELPEAFLENEAKAGTVSALLLSIDDALDGAEKTLAGAALEMTVITHVPDEMVHVHHQDARTWSLEAMEIINLVDQALNNAPEARGFSNIAVIRDAWVCITALASTIAMLSDNIAVDARAFLSQLVDASKAARRATVSLAMRRSLPQWVGGDAFADAVTDPLNKLGDLSSKATDLVATALTQRKAKVGQMDWHIISKGRVEMSDKEAAELIEANIADLPADEAHERAKELQAALEELREDWQRAS